MQALEIGRGFKAENESLSVEDESNSLWQQMVLFQDGERKEEACRMVKKVIEIQTYGTTCRTI